MPHATYLPPGRGDIPALNRAEAGSRLSDPGGMQNEQFSMFMLYFESNQDRQV